MRRVGKWWIEVYVEKQLSNGVLWSEQGKRHGHSVNLSRVSRSPRRHEKRPENNESRHHCANPQPLWLWELPTRQASS